MSLRPEIRKLLLIDSLEAHAEQGAAPVQQLSREVYGGGYTPRLSATQRGHSVSSNDLGALCAHFLGAAAQGGHSIQRLNNGRDIFPAMLNCIKNAANSIEFATYIFEDSDIADDFCAALIARADAGVPVRMLIDGFGSSGIGKRQLKALNDSRVELRVYNPVPGWKFWRFPTRNHRKILVVDGRVAFTGGVGVAKEWTGDAEDPRHYRETQFRLTGPAVAHLRSAFFNDWACVGAELPERLDPVLKKPGDQAGSQAAVVAIRSASKHSRAAWMLPLLARCANHSIAFVSPYFVPSQNLVNELVHAAQRGVAVTLMLSGENTDHKLPLWAGRSSYQGLLDAGVRILEYRPTLLHSKLVILDRSVVCFGSVNMNQRSQGQDEEIAVIAWDRALAGQLDEDFKQDEQHSREMCPEQWRRRGWRHRVLERLAKQLAAHL